HDRGLGRGASFEGILPAAVVDRTGLSPLRACLGQWRPDRRDLPEAGRWQEEEKYAARRRGRLNQGAVVRPSSAATMAFQQLSRANRRAMNSGEDTYEIS